MHEQVPADGNFNSIFAAIAWLAYGALYLGGFWLVGCATGFVIMLIPILNEYRTGTVKIMDCTSLGYFALAAAISTTSASHALEKYHVVIVWGLFAIVGWATLAAGFPFTVQYARERAPREAWDSPLFARINTTLTIMWAIVFTFGAFLGVLIFAIGHAFLLGVAIPISAMGVGYIFNNRYPKRFADRFELSAKSTTVATSR